MFASDILEMQETKKVFIYCQKVIIFYDFYSQDPPIPKLMLNHSSVQNRFACRKCTYVCTTVILLSKYLSRLMYVLYLCMVTAINCVLETGLGSTVEVS